MIACLPFPKITSQAPNDGARQTRYELCNCLEARFYTSICRFPSSGDDAAFFLIAFSWMPLYHYSHTSRTYSTRFEMSPVSRLLRLCPCRLVVSTRPHPLPVQPDNEQVTRRSLSKCLHIVVVLSMTLLVLLQRVEILKWGSHFCGPA